MFNRYLLMQFSLGVRMLLMIVTQWSMMLVPIILVKINRDKFGDYWMITENIPKQIMIGIILALFMSLFLTIVPILLGFKEMVGSTSYSQPWQFIYEFVYVIIGVALAEEFVFRGYIFNKLLEIKNSRWFAIIMSSMLFGIFHIFNGNLLQVFMTAILGFLFCIFREKIKDCTLLSLVIAHGLYDGMITLWVAAL
ncbi:MAG: CPBP family intramembrane metalloprotease [Clostridiales bacterium]|nr:CPBP family intramembrane metalloprotease [Clostridiales bacterium]